MAVAEIQKQVSILFPVSDWRLLHKEAARLRIPLTELFRGWTKPQLERLRSQESTLKTAGDAT